MMCLGLVAGGGGGCAPAAPATEPRLFWAAAFQNADGRSDSEKGAELTLALFVLSDSDPCHLLKVQVKYYPTFR